MREFGVYWRTTQDSVEVLCFDEWVSTYMEGNAGLYRVRQKKEHEAWVVKMSANDFSNRRKQLREGKMLSITQDLLADYDSMVFKDGTDGYALLEGEVDDGRWMKWEEA